MNWKLTFWRPPTHGDEKISARKWPQSRAVRCVHVFWAFQPIAGLNVHDEEERLYGNPEVDFSSYLASGRFWQATGDNWESEFLQIGAYVLLTSFLFQKGSAESKDPDDPDENHPPRNRNRYGSFGAIPFR
jgi:hypothetical protein